MPRRFFGGYIQPFDSLHASKLSLGCGRPKSGESGDGKRKVSYWVTVMIFQCLGLFLMVLGCRMPLCRAGFCRIASV